MPDRQTDNGITLTVHSTTTEHFYSRSHIFHNGTSLRTGHQTARTEDTTQCGLVQGRQTVRVGETAIELNSACLDSIEHFLFTDKNGTSGKCFLGCFRTGRTDDTDAGFGLDGVGESEHVTDDGTVALCPQSDVQFVFLDGGFATDFDGPDISAERKVSIDDPAIN